jgi:hypothetical protein
MKKRAINKKIVIFNIEGGIGQQLLCAGSKNWTEGVNYGNYNYCSTL